MHCIILCDLYELSINFSHVVLLVIIYEWYTIFFDVIEIYSNLTLVVLKLNVKLAGYKI